MLRTRKFLIPHVMAEDAILLRVPPIFESDAPHIGRENHPQVIGWVKLPCSIESTRIDRWYLLIQYFIHKSDEVQKRSPVPNSWVVAWFSMFLFTSGPLPADSLALMKIWRRFYSIWMNHVDKSRWSLSLATLGSIDAFVATVSMNLD